MRKFLLVFGIVLIHGLSWANQPEIDSLKNELSKTTDAKAKCELYYKLSAKHKIADPDQSIEYAQLSLKEAESANWTIGKAHAYYELGSTSRIKANYPEALQYLFKSLKLAETAKYDKMIGLSQSEIAVVYRHTDNLKKAKYYASNALKYNEKSGNVMAQVQNYNELAIANLMEGNDEKGLEYFDLAYQLCLAENQLRNAAVIVGNMGIIYRDSKQWDKAIASFQESSEIHAGLSNKAGVALANQNIGDVYYRSYKNPAGNVPSNLSKSALLDSSEQLLLTTVPIFESLGALKDLAESYRILSEVYQLKKDYQNAFIQFEKYNVLKDSINSADDRVLLAKMGEERAELEKTRQEKITRQQKKLTELSEAKRRNETIGFILGIVVLSVFTIFIFKERRKSERLLLNILPQSVAAELKKKGSSEAQHYNNVTVLFTDFVGFTKVSERLTPQQLVHELDTCFRVFDEIMMRYNIEKIKTIGDAYMAVSGLPEADEKHAENIVSAAQEIIAFMRKRKEEVGEDTFEIRVGVHTGNVVAGIVGVKKFAYDIWGDTVNTAARMEQNSEPGKINISSSTYELIKDDFTCTFRGEIEAKNKGKLSMYFVDDTNA
ncbi:MAG: hypothetical protein NXI10_12055 [bacterium]|nr:hypothetical protein [bacterium]